MRRGRRTTVAAEQGAAPVADLIRAANEKIGWAIFNLGKGKTEAALTLMEKAQAILDEVDRG